MVLAFNDSKKLCANTRCKLSYEEVKTEVTKAKQRMLEEIRLRERAEESLQHNLTEFKKKLIESSASQKILTDDNASLRSEIIREREKREHTEREIAEKEKCVKQFQKELEDKLRAKELSEKLLMENVKETVEKARFSVERLKREKEEERTRAENERTELLAELDSKQKIIDSLSEIVQEKERNEMTLRRECERIDHEREKEKVRLEEEKSFIQSNLKKELESKQQCLDSLAEIVEEKDATLSHEVERLNREREEGKARFEKEKWEMESTLRNELQSEKKHVEQLERETWKLRTKIQTESEMRIAEQKKAEAQQWVRSFISWMASGRHNKGGTSSSNGDSTGGFEGIIPLTAKLESTGDEFADILKRIADDLYEDGKIDSLGSQLGILQGDIQRALMTNVKFNRVTSEGTRHMLQQWREGVSSKDERIELRRALMAAKLIDLADRYLPEEKGTGEEHAKKKRESPEEQSDTEQEILTNDVQLTERTSFKNQGEMMSCSMSLVPPNISRADMQGDDKDELAGGMARDECLLQTEESHRLSSNDTTPLPPKGRPEVEEIAATFGYLPLDDTSCKNQKEMANEGVSLQCEESLDHCITDVQDISEDSISDESQIEEITNNYSDLLSHIALSETSAENLLVILFMKIIVDVNTLKALRI